MKRISTNLSNEDYEKIILLKGHRMKLTKKNIATKEIINDMLKVGLRITGNLLKESDPELSDELLK